MEMMKEEEENKKMMNSLNWFRLNDQSSRSQCVNKLWHIHYATTKYNHYGFFLLKLYLHTYLIFLKLSQLDCMPILWSLKVKINNLMSGGILNSRFNQRRTHRTYYVLQSILWNCTIFLQNCFEWFPII